MIKRINLALQGGGAHGAFTWGAIDRLLEDERIEIAGISGTSAGALNGSALKAGLVRGGPALARENLEWLWSNIVAIDDEWLVGWFSVLSPGQIASVIEHSLPFAMYDAAQRLFSPYDSGAFYANPLRSIVERFHLDAVCSREGPVLHICATNVRTGKIRVFDGPEVTVDAVLASACLPTLFRAVEIDDAKTGRREAYWDGGYTGNPALYPLFDPALPDDIVVININPLVRDAVPDTAREIQNRINEISFNATLLREVRAIAFVQQLLADGAIAPAAMKRVLVHMIADDALMNELSVATKVIPVRSVINLLKDAGRRAADAFLDAHFDDLNERESLDLEALVS